MAKPQIMHRLGNAFLTWRRYEQGMIAHHGMTLNQVFVLRKLAACDWLNPSKIAELLYTDRPTATVIIDNLKKYGWVVSEKDPANRKYSRISITPEGRQKLETMWADDKLSPDKWFDHLACFSEEETKTLAGLLDRLNQHLASIPVQGHPSMKDETAK